jgi:hypothetical protein
MVFLDFYKNNESCIIQKILLSTDKLGIKWYNDITNYTKKPLLFLALKLREEWVDNINAESNIFDTEVNNVYILEIHTLNEVNTLPNLITKEKLYDKLLKELLQDF